VLGGADRDVVVVEPEVDLVAGFDAELVSQFLWDDDLALGTHAVSHTDQYNSMETPLTKALRRPVPAGRGSEVPSE